MTNQTSLLSIERKKKKKHLHLQTRKTTNGNILDPGQGHDEEGLVLVQDTGNCCPITTLFKFECHMLVFLPYVEPYCPPITGAQRAGRDGGHAQEAGGSRRVPGGGGLTQRTGADDPTAGPGGFL